MDKVLAVFLKEFERPLIMPYAAVIIGAGGAFANLDILLRQLIRRSCYFFPCDASLLATLLYCAWQYSSQALSS